MDDLLTAKDERYENLFDADKDAETFGVTIIPDPYPVWKELAARGPVLEGTLPELMGYPAEYLGHFYHPGHPYASAFSFSAVNEALSNPDRISSEFYLDSGIEHSVGDTILSMDGLRHRAYRSTVQPFFSPAKAASWWNDEVISRLVEELVSAIEHRGEADLNADFFARLPMHVVTAGFGMSPEEGLSFRTYFHAGVIPTSTEESRAENMALAVDILRQAVRDRQKSPRDDVISYMLQNDLKLLDGTVRKPTIDEVVDFCRITVGAGGGTTWRQLGITLYALLENPDQLEQVKADRSLLPKAILESLRWGATDPVFPRKVIRDTTLGGVSLRAGTMLHLCLGSANRDPSRWEDPDRFDIHRPIQRSVAFAAGPHSCLGQHVARQEMLVAFNAIFDRLPNLRWDTNKPKAQIIGGLIGRGPGPLHVVFG